MINRSDLAILSLRVLSLYQIISGMPHISRNVTGPCQLFMIVSLLYLGPVIAAIAIWVFAPAISEFIFSGVETNAKNDIVNLGSIELISVTVIGISILAHALPCTAPRF